MLKQRIIALVMIVCLAGTAAAETTGGEKTAAFRQVGNIVTFGRYEQDNNTANGPEEIEWIVLDVKGDQALLLSKYGLDALQYHNHYMAITWEDCSMRSWLNHEFLDAAFTEEEKAAILMTEVDNSRSQCFSEWKTESGNNTHDRVFALSYAEANKYLGVTPDDNKNVGARVAPTAYATAHGAWTNNKWQTAEGADAGRWWLRSPGRHPYRAAHVYGAGSLRNTHVTSYSDHYGGDTVRPALWLDLNADIF